MTNCHLESDALALDAGHGGRYDWGVIFTQSGGEQMKAYTSIMLPLGKDEFNALRENADREYRHPREQARYLLRCALGLTDPNKHETATPAFPGTGSGFVTPHP